MKIVGGFQDGNNQKRILLIEPGDVGKVFDIVAIITGDRGEEGSDL